MTGFQDFMKKVSEKKELGEKLKTLLADEKTENKLETIISFAKQCGVEVMAEDIQKTFKAAGTEEGEIPDKELDAVAGGVNNRDLIEDFYSEIEKLLGENKFDPSILLPGQPIDREDFEYFE